MLAWLILLALLVVEAVAIRWWLTRELYRFFFNDWAAVLYTILLTVDVVIAWLVSMASEPGGSGGLQVLLAVAIGFLVIVFLGTLFFRWVIHLEMTDLSDKDRR